MNELIYDELIDLYLDLSFDNNPSRQQIVCLVCKKDAIEENIEGKGAKKDLGVMIVNNFEEIRENSASLNQKDYFYVPVIHYDGSVRNAVEKIEDYNKKDPNTSRFIIAKKAKLDDSKEEYYFKDYISVVINKGKAEEDKTNFEKSSKESFEDLEKIVPNYRQKLSVYQAEVKELI